MGCLLADLHAFLRTRASGRGQAPTRPRGILDFDVTGAIHKGLCTIRENCYAMRNFPNCFTTTRKTVSQIDLNIWYEFIFVPNVVVECSTFLLHIWEVPGSNLSSVSPGECRGSIMNYTTTLCSFELLKMRCQSKNVRVLSSKDPDLYMLQTLT
jgi:hypothetical protein